MRQLVGLDLETYDPKLKDFGYSWKFNEGYILCCALVYEGKLVNGKIEGGHKQVIAGLNNENCPFSAEQRLCANVEIRHLLEDPNVSLVGANIMYDIGWLLYEYGMTVYDVKCRLIDVLIAESSINEFALIDLDKLSFKYLRYGKKKTNIEAWVRANIKMKSVKSDFRAYLKDTPWELLCEYVIGDTDNPIHIWRKQLTLLQEEKLSARVKLDFDCILPILDITMTGFPINMVQKKINLEKLISYRDELKREFDAQYSVDLNVGSSKQLASFFDKQNIPYRCKITLKGMHNKKFADYHEKDKAFDQARRIVANFYYVKSEPVSYVQKELSERTCDMLEEEGFMFSCSPNIDKKYFDAHRDKYPIVGVIADWKNANGIISKMLGEHYDNFVSYDTEGNSVVKGQYHITKSEGYGTISSRLSSSSPNMQQIPSKGGFEITMDGKKIEVVFPAMTRALFTASPNKVLWKLDYGQIEYRLICHIAIGEGSEEVRQAFAKNPKLDFHQYVMDLTKLDRKLAKNMSFGVSFGMGLPSMSKNFGWTMEETIEIADAYHEHMPFVAPTLKVIGDIAKKNGYIRTVLGSVAHLKNEKQAYTMLNRYTQGSGADILKKSLTTAFQRGVLKEFDMHNTVHDELDFSSEPTKEAVLKVLELIDIMTNTVKLKVPLLVDPEYGDNWNDVALPEKWLDRQADNSPEWINASPEVKKVTNIFAQLMEENLYAKYERKQKTA